MTGAEKQRKAHGASGLRCIDRTAQIHPTRTLGLRNLPPKSEKENER